MSILFSYWMKLLGVRMVSETNKMSESIGL